MRVFILSLLFMLPLIAQDWSGDLYRAERPYNDWFTLESCSKRKGQICSSINCSGSHYIDEFCCCNAQYDHVPPVIVPYIMVANGFWPQMPTVQQSAPFLQPATLGFSSTAQQPGTY